ncbi:MAG: ROK family transcriptional regulator [Candidatus Sumerlaeaceae bacterium]
MRKINLKNFQVATSLTARDINRRIILNVIRTRQPLSRADVARLTGLQRSTVSLIADQLIDEGWIVEGEMGRLPRGRRPIFLQMNTSKAAILGINIRPTATVIALADLNGQFLDQESIETDPDPKVFFRNLTQALKLFMKRHADKTYEGVGVSLPGRVNRETNRLAIAPNLGWRDVDVKTPIERATKLPVEVENAANACALAENYFGEHGAEIDNLVVVTVSEGIGTGIIVNGQLIRGSSGMAGEFGHVVIDPEGPECRCGKRGCWEVLASNTAALRHYASANGKRKAPAPRISFEELLQLAEQGDSRAIEAIETTARNLGHGLAMLVAGFEPNMIAVVGEITRIWPRVHPVIAAAIAERGIGMPATEIVPINDALQPRLRGTIALVLEKHLGAPSVA